MADSPEEIQKSLKKYLAVFAALLVFTVLTVAVATLEIFDKGARGFDTFDMILGLGIASLKAFLVAYIFMHLNHEKKAIYWLFGSGIVFCFALMAITAWAYADPIEFDGFYDGISNFIRK